jgi:hypothetical protein
MDIAASNLLDAGHTDIQLLPQPMFNFPPPKRQASREVEAKFQLSAGFCIDSSKYSSARRELQCKQMAKLMAGKGEISICTLGRWLLFPAMSEWVMAGTWQIRQRSLLH